MHSSVLKLIFTIYLLGSIDNILGKKLVFSNGWCNYNREVFSNFTLRIPNGMIHLDMLIVKPLSNGLRGHMSFDFRASKSKPFQSVFQFDYDYCSVLNSSKNTLNRRVLLSMMKKSNYSTTCPIPPGYYYMHGWKADGNLVPLFLAIGDYRIVGSFYYGKFKKNNDKPLLSCTVEANLDV